MQLNALRDCLKALRDDKTVGEMVHKVEAHASELDLKIPDTLARVSRVPGRFCQTMESEAVAHSAATVIGRRKFYKAVDLVIAEQWRRFNRDSLTLAANWERAIILYDLELLRVPKELDTGRLDLQLQMLGDVTRESRCSTVKHAASCLSKLHPQTRALCMEAGKLIELFLCLPVSVASSEQSFSNLRRLKTWLRSTMMQKRHTHLSLINVHTNIIDINELRSNYHLNSWVPSHFSSYLRGAHTKQGKLLRLLWAAAEQFKTSLENNFN